MLPNGSILPEEDGFSTSGALISVVMSTPQGDEISRSNATVAFRG